jgi:putative oxidoreductase
MIVAVMVVAIATVHWEHGVFAQNNGIELPLLYAVGAASVAFSGFGAYSLDALLGLSWPQPVIWVALALGVAGGAGNLALRKTGAAAQHV